MALEFTNTGTNNTDYITYSGVPAVAGLATCSMVLRIAGDSNCPNFSGALHLQQSGGYNDVSVGREGTVAKMYFCFRNGSSAPRQTFPFTFDGTMRSVVVCYDGGASPKTTAYVDGSAQTISGTAFTNTTIGSGQTACVIGGSTGFRWNGRIAEAAIYNRVITPAEALIHTAGYTTNHFPRGRIFCAPLIRELHDIVGGLTGTATGTSVSEHPRIYA